MRVSTDHDPRSEAWIMAQGSGASANGWSPSGRCVVFACDIVSFGAHERLDHIQRHLRDELYRRLRLGFEESGVPFDGCHHEDRGDGVLVVPPRDTPPEQMISPLTERLDAELRRQHEVASDLGRIRLRVGLHAGPVQADDEGIVGNAVNHTFRLMEAPEFKRRVAESGSRLALIVSQQLYDEVVRQDVGLIDPSGYERLDVVSKETTATGWIRLFGVTGGAVTPGGTEVAVPERGVPEVGDQQPPGPGAHAHAGADVRFDAVDGPPLLSRRDLLEIVERLLDLPIMASASGRDQVLWTLSPDIARMVARQPEARMDTYGIVQTCADHPEGMRELLEVLHQFVGPSAALLRLKQTLTRLYG